MKLPSPIGLVFCSVVSGIVLGSVAAASDVITVRADGTGDYKGLAVAIQAAKDGDVLLVQNGNYQAAQVSTMSLAIVADEGHAPVISGGFKVKPLGKSKTVLLSGLTFQGLQPSATTSMHGLIVNHCKGAVRIDDCVLIGWDQPAGGYFFCEGGTALSVGLSANVAVTRSTLTGGRSGHKDSFCWPAHAPGGNGLWAKGSRVAAWRSLFYGGLGGTAVLFLFEPGDGGPGARLENSKLYTFHNLFQGGRGGDDMCPSIVTCGDGGPGILGGPLAKAFDKSTIFKGGKGGVDLDTGAVCNDGPDQDLAPGEPTIVPGYAYGLKGPRVVREGQTITLEVLGKPGDQGYLAISTSTRFRYQPALQGAWYVRQPLTTPMVLLGIVDATGHVTRTLRAPKLAPGEEAQVFYLQLLVRDVMGNKRLGSPISIVVLDSQF